MEGSKAEPNKAFLLPQRGPQQPVLRSGEDLLLVVLLAVSASFHMVFILVEDFSLFNESTPIIEDWAIDAEIVTDIDLGAPDKSAFPDAEKAKEAKAPEDMLPQLPKKFAIKDAPKPEDMVAEDDLKDPAKEADKPEPKKPEPKKPEPKKKDVKSVDMQADKDEQNRLKKADALKRLMAEKLRNQNKLAKNFEAEQDDPKARLANLVLKNKKLNAGVFSGKISATSQKYGSQLMVAIGGNYTLPAVYQYGDQDIVVEVSIVLMANGTIRELSIAKSSGEAAFDEFVIKAVKSSSPLPAPPKEFAEEKITLRLTPKSF